MCHFGHAALGGSGEGSAFFLGYTPRTPPSRLRSRVVLDDINAVLPGGKITVILGESGCGKSTLLRHVIGLSRPMQGHILYGGQDLFALPERQFRRVRRRFGVLFQDGALLGSLTLAENVGLPLHEHTRLPKATIRSTVLRILDLVGLAEFADYYPNELIRRDEEARRIGPRHCHGAAVAFLRRADLRGSIRSTRPKWISFCWICARHTRK